MLKQLMSYFGSRSAASRTRQQQYVDNTPFGNRGMAPSLQHQTIQAAQAKRERKLQRAQGWFNG